MRHAQVLGIELLTQTGGVVVPRNSYLCSLRCFSLSYSWNGNESEEGGWQRLLRFGWSPPKSDVTPIRRGGNANEFRSHGRLPTFIRTT